MNAFSSPVARTVLAALTLSTCALLTPSFSSSARADDLAYPYTGQSEYTLRGIVRRVDADSSHLTVVGDDDHVYVVDAYGADIILPDVLHRADMGDLTRGMRVRARGTLVGHNLVEAETVRVLSDSDAPHETVPPLAAVSVDASAGAGTLDGVVRLVDTDHARITVADGDGGRVVVDTFDSAITLGNGDRSSQTGDLTRGMHVLVSGTRLSHGRMVADRVRVLSDVASVPTPAPQPAEAVLPPMPVFTAPQPATRRFGSLIPPSPDPQFVMANLDSYTGILIDARHLSSISRSPSPAVYGPEPGKSLIYPDRSHVPTPDEVQDESVVRYYHTEAEAEAGIAGSNPLILPAQAVLTPAKDSLQLSPDDMVLFNALEKKLHYSLTWRVGFLIPGNQ